MSTGPAPDGVVVVDKPGGLTSHDVVARVRRLAGTRRVGHAGTLDPMATGVLVLGVGRATRLLGHLGASDKTYAATVRLGSATTTDDAEGEILASTPARDLSAADVRAAAAGFVGPLDQVPSAVSAVKVAGERAHARVRRGEQVRLAPRPVVVHAFDVRSVTAAGEHTDLEVLVTCSAGTYVRALARDLGARLGVGGHLTRLRRTASGPFTAESAHPLEALADRFELLDLATVAASCFPTLVLDEEQATWAWHGRRLPGLALPEPAPSGPVALLGPEGSFLALYTVEGADAVPVAVFVG